MVSFYKSIKLLFYMMSVTWFLLSQENILVFSHTLFIYSVTVYNVVSILQGTKGTAVSAMTLNLLILNINNIWLLVGGGVPGVAKELQGGSRLPEKLTVWLEG